jgi:putative methyltransferase (TIGR04325 family)
MTTFAHAAKRLVRPLVPRFLLEPWKRRLFFQARGWQNLHWGTFDSFQDALAFAQRFEATTRFGASHEEILQRHLVLKPHDYPVLFWLARVLPTLEGGRLVDLGGSIGASYYAYRDRLALRDDLAWTVCELSEVVAAGRTIAAQRNAPHLRFSDDMADLDHSSILFSAGCLQYIERPLAELLASLRVRPSHLIINRLALTERKAFVTLQNTGYSISPCRVDNVEQFVASLAALGYRQEDSWKCLANRTEVPFHPECTLPHFYGFYFCRVDAPSHPAASGQDGMAGSRAREQPVQPGEQDATAVPVAAARDREPAPARPD